MVGWGSLLAWPTTSSHTDPGHRSASCTRSRGGASAAALCVELVVLRARATTVARRWPGAPGPTMRPTSTPKRFEPLCRASARIWRRRRSARTPPDPPTYNRATKPRTRAPLLRVRGQPRDRCAVPRAALTTTSPGLDARLTTPYTPRSGDLRRCPGPRVALLLSRDGGHCATFKSLYATSARPNLRALLAPVPAPGSFNVCIGACRGLRRDGARPARRPRPCGAARRGHLAGTGSGPPRTVPPRFRPRRHFAAERPSYSPRARNSPPAWRAGR